jgi:sugar lactone lactonase YvrE
VYVFNRGTHPVVVFDRSGKLLETWGDGAFKNPHGFYGASDDTFYCVDTNDHTVRKFTDDGELLLTLGTPGVPSETGSSGYTGYANSLDSLTGGPPFNRPSIATVSSDGDIWVADGYGNCKVHRFSPDGELKYSWGAAGRGPGQFRLPHSVYVSNEGKIFVVDRENDRIQILGPTGKYLDEWAARRPEDIRVAKDGMFYVAEHGYPLEDVPSRGLGSRITIRNPDGIIVSAWGDDGEPWAPGNFVAPRGIAFDSEESLYVAECTYTARVRRNLVPPGTHCLQKFMRVR